MDDSPKIQCTQQPELLDAINALISNENPLVNRTKASDVQ